MTAVYPTDGATQIAVNSEYVLVFNMPVNGADLDANIIITSTLNVPTTLVQGTHYEVYDINGNNPPTDPTTIARIVFNYGGVNPLLGGDGISITVGAGIHEAVSVASVPINLSATVGINATSPWTFTTGTAPDVTDPAITGGTNSPTGGTEPLDTTVVQITFDDADIDISSIHYNTFYFEDSTFNRITAAYSYNSGTRTATLTPITNLQPGMTYHAWELRG